MDTVAKSYLQHLKKPWIEPATWFLQGKWFKVRFSGTIHYANLPMQYTVIFFQLSKIEIFFGKILIFFLFFSQTIDCGYSLEPTINVLKQKKEKQVYPCIPQFCYIKVGFKGVYITQKCFPDENFLRKWT